MKTAAAHGCFGIACVTALTVQSSQGVVQVQPISSQLVTKTLEALAADMEIAAVRIGMLGSGEVATAVASFLERRHCKQVVLDPILRSSSGMGLLEPDGIAVLKDRLLRSAVVVTPNLEEAAVLWGAPVVTIAETAAAAEGIQRLGAKNVLITGGHLDENTDILRTEAGETHQILGLRVESKATHGTGCALATAIACNLAHGMDVLAAAISAKEYVRRAIQTAFPIGKGFGPMNHLFRLDQ